MDEHGQQISELQGRFEDVKEKVEAAADDQTEWNGWDVTLVVPLHDVDKLVEQAKKLSDEHTRADK